MKTNLLRAVAPITLYFTLTLFSFAQQMGGGYSTTITDFSQILTSGGYTGYNPNGSVPTGEWQHLFVVRHGNSANNYQLQLGSSLLENDNLYFRKIADGGLGTPNPAWFEIATRGTNTFTGSQNISGNLQWGTDPTSWWGFGMISMNSGWGSYNFPTIGSIGGSEGSLIMLHNPHMPFRTDNAAPSYSGRAGMRMAIDQSGSNWWDAGLAGDFFHIYRSNSGEFFRINNSGNVGIGTTNPETKLSVISPESDVLHISKSTGDPGDNIYLAFSHGGVTSSSNVRARIGTNIKPGGAGRLTFHTGGIGTTPERMRIDENGNVGIGVINPFAKLEVDGTIVSEEVKVQVVSGPDYVFESDYDLFPLADTKKYIEANRHLPEIPSAKEMEENGITLGEMNMLLLKKIEELTLHLIEKDEQIKSQEELMTQVLKRMDLLEMELTKKR